MARPKETNKTLMDQNISYGLNIVQEGIEAQKNGEEIVDSKIDLYEIADFMDYLSRHSDIPFQIPAQKDEKIIYAAIEAGWLHRPSFWAIRQEFDSHLPEFLLIMLNRQKFTIAPRKA